MADYDEVFCANPRCVLHVSPRDPHVAGRGQWAELPNGVLLARVLVGNRYYCHVCAEHPDEPPAIEELRRR